MLWAALKENETSHLSSPSNADLCQSLFLRNYMNLIKEDLVSKNKAFYFPSCPSLAGYNFTSAKKWDERWFELCLMSLSSFELVTEDPRLSWPGSTVQRVGVLTAKNHHCRLFMWSGQQLHFAGDVALRMTIWFLLPKNVVLGLLGLNVLLLQQNGVCNPEWKNGALNLSFAKPRELQVYWSIAPQIAAAALLASWGTYELCGYGCLPALQVHAGEAKRGRGSCNAAASCPRCPPGRQSLTSRNRKAGRWPGWMPWSQWQLPSPLLFLPTPLPQWFEGWCPKVLVSVCARVAGGAVALLFCAFLHVDLSAPVCLLLF